MANRRVKALPRRPGTGSAAVWQVRVQETRCDSSGSPEALPPWWLGWRRHCCCPGIWRWNRMRRRLQPAGIGRVRRRARRFLGRMTSRLPRSSQLGITAMNARPIRRRSTSWPRLPGCRVSGTGMGRSRWRAGGGMRWSGRSVSSEKPVWTSCGWSRIRFGQAVHEVRRSVDLIRLRCLPTVFKGKSSGSVFFGTGTVRCVVLRCRMTLLFHESQLWESVFPWEWAADCVELGACLDGGGHGVHGGFCGSARLGIQSGSSGGPRCSGGSPGTQGSEWPSAEPGNGG